MSLSGIPVLRLVWMPVADGSDHLSKALFENKAEARGFTGQLGIGFLDVVSMPVKGAAQLAGYTVDVPRPNQNVEVQQTGAEKTGRFLGAGVGNALLYIGATALTRKIPIVGKQAVVATGAVLGFLNPTAEGEGLGTRTANALIGAGTNAILKFSPGAAGKKAIGGDFFPTSLKRATLSSGAAGLFNTQASSLLYTGRPAGLQESVSSTLAWAGSGAVFHTAGAAFSGRRATGGQNSGLENNPNQLSLLPTPKFVRNYDADLTMARQFTADIEAGVKLQKEVGPWIAVLGSSAPRPGSSAYRSVYETGKRIATDLKLPVGTGNGPGSMEAANKGAFDHGGVSAGIYLEGLPSEQYQNPFTTHAIRCKTLLARQHLLLSGAKGVVVGPDGGAGTLFEWSHQAIEMRRKVFNPQTPVVFLDDNSMWSQFRGWLGRNILGRGLMHADELDHTFIAHSPAEVIEILRKNLPKLEIAT